MVWVKGDLRLLIDKALAQGNLQWLKLNARVYLIENNIEAFQLAGRFGANDVLKSRCLIIQ